MRCISPSRNYSIAVFGGKEQIVVDAKGFATRLVIDEPIIANFAGEGLLDWELEPALSKFNFSGIPEGVNPLTRISVFDTEAYVESRPEIEDDSVAKQALLDKIDTRLRKLQGRFPNEFIIVEKPLTNRPWPTYDTDSTDEVLMIQTRIGISAEAIRLYELENQNREDIVSAMLALEEGAVHEEVTLSA